MRFCLSALHDAGMSVPILFDQQLIRQHRQRAAPRYSDFAFLKDAAAARLADRLELMQRDFDLCLDVGAHDGRLAQHFAGLGKIGHMIHTDPAETICHCHKTARTGCGACARRAAL